MINIQELDLKAVNINSEDIVRIMYNDDLVWPEYKDFNTGKSYIMFLSSDEYIFSIKLYYEDATKDDIYLEYSLDNNNWNVFDLNSTITFGHNIGNLYLRGINEKGLSEENDQNIIIGVYFRFSSSLGKDTNIKYWEDPETKIYSYGDIRSLIDYRNCETCDTSKAVFRGLFHNCTTLVSSPVLPAMNLASHCYQDMFFGCYNLKQAPELPATTLSDFCYKNMFTATKIEYGPDLPATTLTRQCYANMFNGYNDGFTKFYSTLSYIKMMATDISATQCLHRWIGHAKDTGIFVKNSAATWDVTGEDGIPEGWTVLTATQ